MELAERYSCDLNDRFPIAQPAFLGLREGVAGADLEAGKGRKATRVDRSHFVAFRVADYFGGTTIERVAS